MSFEMTTLGEYAKVQGGYAYKSEDFHSDGLFPVLKIKNVRFGYVDYSETSYIENSIASATNEWSTREGDVLISMTGSGPNAPQSLVGRVARIWKNEPKAWINQRVGRIILKDKKKIHPDFLFYLLSSPRSQEYLVSNSSGSANQANISGKTIESLPCPRVTFDESFFIAKILRELDEKILLNRQINQTLEQIAQAIFKSWFVDFDPVKAKIAAKENGEDPERAAMRAISGKTDAELDQLSPEQIQQLSATVALFPDEFEDSELGGIPRGWRVKSLNEIATYLNGLALQKFPPKEDELGLPIIKIAEMRSGFTDKSGRATEDLDQRYIIRDGDILFSWSGSLLLKQWQFGPGALNQHLFKVTSDIYPKWFCYFATLHHLPWFQYIAASKATTLGHIQRKHLCDAKIAICPSQLLEAGDNILEPILDKSLNVMLENNSLEQIKDILLPKLLSGELDIQAA